MDKRRKTELHGMMKDWARAYEAGVFESMGWKAGGWEIMSGGGTGRPASLQVNEIHRLRRAGHTDAVLVQSALLLAVAENRRPILALKFRYLSPGTWEEQADQLAMIAGGMTLDAYRIYVKAGLHALDAELRAIENSVERVARRYWRQAGETA